jgi:hypothetical protein
MFNAVSRARRKFEQPPRPNAKGSRNKCACNKPRIGCRPNSFCNGTPDVYSREQAKHHARSYEICLHESLPTRVCCTAGLDFRSDFIDPRSRLFCARSAAEGMCSRSASTLFKRRCASRHSALSLNSMPSLVRISSAVRSELAADCSHLWRACSRPNSCLVGIF